MISILALAVSALSALAPIKVHVDGEGYMRFIRDGRVVYAKSATLVDIDGALGVDGAKLLPTISIPDSVGALTIDLAGNVDAGDRRLGRLVLGMFPPGAAESSVGSFVTSSDRATLAGPGDENAGVIRTDGVESVAEIRTAPNAVFKPTGSNINLEIVGAGYFLVNGPAGIPCYTRKGSFKVSPDGLIETSDGFALEPNICVPAGIIDLCISATGVVSGIPPGAGEQRIFGTLQLTTFPSPEALEKLNATLLRETATSGTPRTGVPGDGIGLIKFNGALHGDSSRIAAKQTTPRTVATKATAKPIAGAQIEIIVRQHTDLTAKTFSLGDIATITGPEDQVAAYKKVSIGATAIAGVNRIVDQKYVVLKLMGAGFRPGSYALVVPEGADVARKTVTVSGDDIVAAAVKAAQDKMGMKAPFKSSETILPIIAEDGEVSIETSEPTLSNKNYRVVVTVRQGSSIVATRTVTLAPPGDLVSIKVGDAVTVLMKAGSAVIEVPGKALSQGYVGQHIQVSIAGVGSKPTTQTGVVIDTGKVEVDL